jgi:hypothetical protein
MALQTWFQMEVSKRKMLRVLLVFFWYFLNCDVTFKITIEFEIIIFYF